MPRANRYLKEGYTYHLTHRCHNREFMLKAAKERNEYRKWLREGAQRFRVSVYNYIVTSNHIHIIAHCDSPESIGKLMHLASGSTAKNYNLRKNHLGSMWEHPYQCTLIENGEHLFNCLRYVDLNMVRAGKVPHPRDWAWSGYHELIGERKRYCILDIERLLESLNMQTLEQFRENYQHSIEEALKNETFKREAHWTDSLAIGSSSFIERIQEQYADRHNLYTDEQDDGRIHIIREEGKLYSPDLRSRGEGEARA